ncbi:AAA family ATPase [Halorussus gelatinilyticus]|uniref:AAA family ATPase n=1 Tax=Halorussus gelatinilyticus TaxID=2937524 RepID=A0A8U0IN09_9EURY|nr:AAA family ATPase [Halorussus gelatinilyticus]UPW01966.1 AAA family ATPase [Halorussus gelatinilyticus]
MTRSTAALVGATGGAGTTRLAVELGATLVRDGREVAVLDADFATEGLARHLSGRIDPDVTTLLTEDGTLADGLREHPATADLAGRLELCPARGPFERLARAKTADAAQRFEQLLAEAANRFDHVLVDAPPVAANQAVAAVTSAERVAVVAPASERGVDAVQRTRGRVTDVGANVDAVVATRAGPEHPLRSADAAVPTSDATTVADVPASAPDPETTFAPAVAHAAEVVFDAELGLEFEEAGLFDVEVGEFVPDALS